MSSLGETMKALCNDLLLQGDVRQPKDMATSQSGRLEALAEARAALRDRVSRLQGVIEGAAMATQQRRVED